MQVFTEKEIEKFFEENKKILFTFGKNLSKDLSFIEDMIQESFIKLSKQDKNKFQDEKHVKMWLFTVCRNTFLKKNQKNERFCSLEDDYDSISDENSPLEDYISQENKKELLEKINKIFSKMSHRHKEALRLKYFTDVSQEEIIKRLNALNTNNFHVLVNCAKSNFRKLWAQDKISSK
jgi:RNA polymerase sigma factor (sigma-70 family)